MGAELVAAAVPGRSVVGVHFYGLAAARACWSNTSSRVWSCLLHVTPTLGMCPEKTGRPSIPQNSIPAGRRWRPPHFGSVRQLSSCLPVSPCLGLTLWGVHRPIPNNPLVNLRRASAGRAVSGRRVCWRSCGAFTNSRGTENDPRK